MLSEEDVSRAVSETIELFFYPIKADDRPTWIGTITETVNKRRPEMRYHDIYSILEQLCLDHSGKSEYKPKLGKVLRSLILGHTATDKESARAEWEAMEDCEFCLEGKRHALLWDSPDHAEIYYYQCDCPKGQAMQVPIYVSPFEEIEKMREKHGDLFDCGKTEVYHGQALKVPNFGVYDEELGKEIPF